MTMTSDATTDPAVLDDDSPVMVFSADTHVGPRMQNLWPYCPKRYLSDFDEFTASDHALPAASNEVHDFTYSDEYKYGHQRNLLTAGHHDPHAWLRDVDRDGVCGGVIFHQPTGENALDAYPRLDGKALSEVAERIGVKVKDFATAPDLSNYPYTTTTGTMAFRTIGSWS